MNGRMTRGWRSNSNFKSIPSHQKGGQKVVCRLVEKCTVSRRSALGRLHKLCSGAWKWHFWIISSVSPKGTTKQCTFEKRDSLWGGTRDKGLHQRKWFQLMNVCIHRPWCLRSHITRCVPSSVAFGNPLLGIGYFLSEHLCYCKVSTGHRYLI